MYLDYVYRIIDSHTGRFVGGTDKTRSRASAKADKLDNIYGAVRYRVVHA